MTYDYGYTDIVAKGEHERLLEMYKQDSKDELASDLRGPVLLMNRHERRKRAKLNR